MDVEQQRAALSISEFCRWAGIGRTLVYKEIECGNLKIKKVGRRTIITMESARKWMEALPATA